MQVEYLIIGLIQKKNIIYKIQKTFISYMNAAKEGDNVEVEAVTRKLGKKLAFLEVEVRNKDKNQLLATGRHTKYVGI